MTTTDEGGVNQLVFEMTVAMVKDYCETRIGQGASNEELNEELKEIVPAINAWSRRQRRLLKLTTEMLASTTMTRQ